MQSSRQTVEAKKPEQAVSNLRIKSSELIIFTTQLSVMLESGVVLSDALEAIAQQTRPGITKLVIQDVADRIKSGDCFSSALAQYPRIFSAMYVSMVKASEASGNMARMLQILSGYLNADADTRKQVKGAMIYPFVMLMMAIAATGSLMFFVLPRFTKIYESRGAALPKLTQVLVTFSSLLGNMRFMTAAVTLAVCLGILFWIWKQTTSGRKTLDWILVHTPIFGTMFIDACLPLDADYGAMVNTGVSLLEALDVMKTSCDNYYFQSLWAAADSKIRDGYQLSDSIVLAPHSELVAPGIIQMLRAGEKSGQIGQVADKVSIFYEKKLANSIRTATSLIEPLMVMIMGVVIGTIAIALLLPVFRISTIIAQ